ncbi:unnamed protein product [Cuscuta campestris]|uniref:Uncharacterized protein n=1 Tax=Cuscuta campestris TaxID=132261 RepID=A0A484K7T9_9ASTE|nr:unnamed protein product [Cuscuta campestris]
MFDVRPGSKETLGFVVVSSHQGRAFLCGLPPSNKKWNDKYLSIKFPPAAFPFVQNVWGKRIKRQVKPQEADDLVTWEATLQAGDASTRSLYNVGKCGVYPGRETDPELEIVLTEAIPHAIPLHRVKGSKAPVSTTTSPSRPGKKKKEKEVKFNSKFATPKIEYFTQLVKSRDEEKARLEAMMVTCRKDAQAAHAKAEKVEEKLVEHYAVYRQLYAKHEGLLKAAKEADTQAQEKIEKLEADSARSAEEIARLRDELAKERAERAALAAAWATQEPEEFAALALPD